jgi:hypothetical protein
VRLDVWAYVLGGFGGLILAFAGAHGFQNKSVTIIAFGIGAILLVIGGCLYWQDAIWKSESEANARPSARDQGALVVVASIAGEPLQPEVGQTFHVIVKLINRGHSPAKKVRANVVTEPVRAGEAPSFVYTGDPVISIGTMAPDVEHQATLRPVTSKSTGESRPLTQELFEELQTGRTRIFVHGRIDYEEPNKTKHWATFCYFLITPFNGHFGLCDGDTNQTDD